MLDQTIMTELKVSGHLMKLESGLYCVFQRAGERAPDTAAGLPGVRISLPPAGLGSSGRVEISGFRADGWISCGQDAALIRVNDGPAEVLVTIYQSANRAEGHPPELRIVRLGEQHPGALTAGTAPPPCALPAEPPPTAAPAPRDEIRAAPGALAHVQGLGDVRTPLGEWVGKRGSKRWIEGFQLDPPPGLAAGDLEYRAVLGRGWVSPWSQAGQFCGSRHMGLPMLGLIVRLGEAAASAFECGYLASFTDGSVVGPVTPGECCAAASLAPLESLQVILRSRRHALTAPAHPSVAFSSAEPEPARAPTPRRPEPRAGAKRAESPPRRRPRSELADR
ncbi:MAG: hypothetical protein ACREFZ_03565 [Acetobacteraceae bacterium]